MSAQAQNAATVAANVVNGLNVDDLQQVIAGVAADPANGQTRWKVSSAWQGQTHSRHVVKSCHIGGQEIQREFSLDVDEPAELGGGNRFPNPQEYLLTALNACITVGYVAQCALHGINLEKVEVETQGEIDLRGFLGMDGARPGFKSLHYTVRIKGDGTPEQFKAIHEAVKATSPNYDNLSRPIPLEPTLIVE